MEDGYKTKPTLIQLEALRYSLLENLYKSDSAILKISYHLEYIHHILQFKNPNIEESFLVEILDDYLRTIKKYEVWGNEPKITKKIVEQLKILCELGAASNYREELNYNVQRIEKQQTELTLVLNGDEIKSHYDRKAYFPLVSNELPEGFYGILDSVTVKISKASHVNKFIIVPSEKEIEQKISDQCTISWKLALKLSRKYIKKPFQYHEVVISFDKRFGFYEGNSLGAALTLAFLEEILRFYNPTYIIDINEKCVFTGGVTETGEIINTGQEIIKRKLAAVFFSEQNVFVVPKDDEDDANFVLKELIKEYPKRRFNIVGVENIEDILNRRDLVDITKQKVIVRTGKFIKRNWVSAAAIILLALLFGYLFVMDWDDNPATLTADGSILYIKNKNGKNLWTKLVNVSKAEIQSNYYYSKAAKVVDINNDKLNEIIICRERDPGTNLIKNSAMVICYNSGGEEVWNYIFQDTVLSDREILNTEYTINLLDTVTFQGQKSLLLYASNDPSFSSAIFRLDLKTGKRLPGTFWASGHIMDGMVKDIDHDGKKEIVGVGYENGYEDIVFFAYELDTLIKVRPTTEQYLIRNYPVSKMKSYIRFPKTDFDNYYETRTPGYNINSFSKDINNLKYIFSTTLPRTSDEAAVGYEINYDLKNINVVIGSTFRIQRDTLVAHGKLNQPYTDTETYKEILRNNILYWKDGKWVRINQKKQ